LETSGARLTPFYDVMSGYFLSKNNQIHLSKLKLAMKVGNSGHYSFRRILKRHYEETFIQCGFFKDDFQEINEDLKNKYEKLIILDTELDPNLKRETLEIILDGMKERSLKIF
jgi:serine/threonine protein kinase HipA of HipAB toxin-antitoxin module